MSVRELYSVLNKEQTIILQSENFVSSAQNRISVLIKLSDKVDIRLLEKASMDLLKSNEYFLRTVRDLYTENSFSSKIKDALSRVSFTSGKEAEAFAYKYSQNEFDQNKDCICQLFIIETSDSNYLFATMHHAAFDGISANLTLDTIFKIYRSNNECERLQTLESAEQYVLDQEKRYNSSKRYVTDQKFWMDLQLYCKQNVDFLIKPTSKTTEATRLIVELPTDFKQKLLKSCMEYHISEADFFLTALALTMAPYYGGKDVCIGMTLHNRNAYTMNKLCMTTGVVPLFFQKPDCVSYIDYMYQLKDNMLRTMKHARYPMVDIGNIFDVLFSFQINHSILTKNECETSSWLYSNCASIPLSFSVTDYASSQRYQLVLDALKPYANSGFAQMLLERYTDICVFLIDNIHGSCSVGSLITKKEHTVIDSINDTHNDYPNNKNAVSLLCDTVAHFSNKIAFKYLDSAITFSQLDNISNRIAHNLISNGVKTGDKICLVFNRSIEMACAIWGVIKSGAAYIPLNPQWPQQRIEMIVNSSSSRFVVIGDDISSVNTVTKVVKYSKLINQDFPADLPKLLPTDILYCIFTSGSSGTPKGVAVMHRNLINVAFSPSFDISSNDIYLQIINYTFDVSVIGFLVCPIRGASVVIASDDIIRDAAQTAALVEKSGATIMNTTTALYREWFPFLKSFNGIRKIMTGGEKFRRDDAAMSISTLSGKLINAYGPTETTVYSTAYTLTSLTEGEIPIGKPIANTQVYLLDDKGKRATIMQPAELCIADDGVSAGYFNNPESEAFEKNPFGEGKMYHTGDICRINPFGELEYIGRNDSQIKLRGYRIDTIEIEQTICKLSANVKCTVTVEGNTLVAYIESATEINAADITEKLYGLLPSYMIPSVIVQVEHIPLNENGKVDTKWLQSYRKTYRNNDCLPQTATEKIVAHLFSERIGIDSFDCTVPFFTLGGESIDAMHIVPQICDQFGINLTVNEFNNNSSVRELAAYIDKTSKNKSIAKPVMHIPKQTDYAVAPSQEMIYSICKSEKDMLSYNIPTLIKLNRGISFKRLEQCINTLISRHNSFRARFTTSNGKLRQKIKPYKYSTIETIRINELSKIKDFIRPFDLKYDMPARFLFIKCNGRKYLFADYFHSFFDGMSIAFIMRELSNLYFDQMEMESMLADEWQYIDYCEYIASQSTSVDYEYWKNTLIDTKPANIKDNIIRSNDISTDEYNTQLDRVLSSKVRESAQKHNCSLLCYLLSAFCITLTRYNNYGVTTVGTLISSRTRNEFQNIVGMMCNTIPVTYENDRKKTTDQFISEIFSYLGNAYDHQSLGFNGMVQCSNVIRENHRNPLFDIMFILQNISFDTKIGVSVTNGQYTAPEKFDMTFELFDNECLGLHISYRTSRYDRTEIELFAQRYIAVLEQMSFLENCCIADFELYKTEDYEMISKFRSKSAKFPKNVSATEIMLKCSRRFRNRVAVLYNGRKVSYSDLYAKASHIARYLNHIGLGKDSIVGVFADRSVEMVELLVGVLLSGAAYMPIDVDTPSSRIDQMLSLSDTKLVITHSTKTFESRCEYISYENIMDTSVEWKRITNTVDSESRFCILFTSGSTGVPKGVCILHRNVVELCCNNTEPIYKNYLNVANYVFDVSLYGIYSALLHGTTVTIIDKGDAMDSTKLAEIIERNSIEAMFIPTAMFNHFTERDYAHMSSIKRMYVGGERLSVEKANIALLNLAHGVLFNAYGPTETCCFSTFMPLYKDQSYRSIPIGYPRGCTTIRILDENMHETPVGINGTIFIAGPGTSGGYINNNELTMEKFRTDIVKGECLYNTGDIGNWRIDGAIEFWGRQDKQIKIRGFRIELDEIKSAVLQFNGIEDAFVLVRDGIDSKELVLFYISRNDQNEDTLSRNIEQHLKSVFQEFMVPRYYHRLDRFPLNANGKVDTKALAQIKVTALNSNEYDPPVTDTEKKIAAKWCEILKRDRISRNDDFFKMGGFSYQALSFISDFRDEGIDISINEMLDHPSLLALAEYIDGILERRVRRAYSNGTVFTIEKVGMFKKISEHNNCDHAIFFFPTYMLNIAYAITFTKMAEDFSTWDAYLGNFTDSENYLSEYLRSIVKISRNYKKVVFIGYSFGGSLAYEIAKGALKHGVPLKDIIILDSFFKTDVNSGFDAIDGSGNDQAALREYLETKFEFYRQLNNKMKDEIEHCFIDFFEHTRLLVNEKKKLPLTIHFLRADHQELDVADTRNEWQDGCAKFYREYKGYGLHNDMLNQENLNRNIDVIFNILNNIRRGEFS